MIYTSLAALVLSATTVLTPMSASPITRLMHMHPHATEADTRVSVALHNIAPIFRDVKVNGVSYTIKSGQTVNIKAPSGTLVLADSRTGTHRRGDLLVQMDVSTNQTIINLD